MIVTAFDANQQTNVTYCTSQGFQVIEDWNEAQGSLALGDTLLKNVYASYVRIVYASLLPLTQLLLEVSTSVI